MDSFRPNFAVPKFLRHRFATIRLLYSSLRLLFLVAFFAGWATAADVPSAPASSLGTNLSFSVGDFDGDAKPDLASVQSGKSGSAHTDYWIQLQLSAAGRQTFQIFAPVGGLQILARDVNGDHALDLVLITTWLGQPVAILLNDGHGNFSRVEPAAIPEAFSESKIRWRSTTDQLIAAVGVPPQPREDLCSNAGPFLHLRSQSRFVNSVDSRFGIGPLLISQLARAPPLEVSHS